MFRLPDLEPWCNGQCWLSTVGMSEVAALLLPAGSQPSGPEAWANVLQWEPGLVLWAAAGLRWRLDGPPQLDELADWLHREGTAQLAREEAQRASPHSADSAAASSSPGSLSVPDDEQRGRLARWAAASVAVARAVGELTGSSQYVAAGMLQQLGATPAMPAWLAELQFAGPLPDQLLAAAQKAAGRTTGSLSQSPQHLFFLARREVGRRWLPLQYPIALGRLAQLTLRAAALQNRFEQELRCEKLAALKELAYGASHELNNPLANITTRAQALMRDEPDPDRRRKLAMIVSQGFRAHEMISDMMLFAKPPRLEPQEFDLAAAVRQVGEELQEAAAWQHTDLRVEASEPLPYQGDAAYLGEAVKAVCVNALEAVGQGGRVRLLACAEPQAVRIEVEDTGPGLNSRERRHLFDPYFSGREAGRGLGLGLSKCWTIVQQHGGAIELLEGPGARFVIRLPVVRG